MMFDHNINPQIVITVSRGSERLGYVVIDSTVGGQSRGGVRLMPDIDEDEVSCLARAMTLKFGFVGLPQGGAKAGVLGNPEAPLEERLELLASFGQAIAPLIHSRVYIPHTDMGTDNTDIIYMLRSIGMPIKKREFRSKRSGYYTAFTVFTGIKQAASHLGLDLSGCRVAIEGFGKVGSALSHLLDTAQARVVAISTSKGAIYNPKGLDVKRLNQLAGLNGSSVVNAYTDAERINCDELLELPVDLLCPCARHDTVLVDNADRIRARIICSGANNPITPDAESVLFDKGVLCLPFFMTNCGGVLGNTMEFASIGKDRIESFIDCHISARIALLLNDAAQKRVSPSIIATQQSLRRFEEVRRHVEHPTLPGRLFGLGLELYRRGWIPGSLVAPLSLPYFKRALA